MEHFSYCLFLSLMHSLWQAALLLCSYTGSGLLIKRTNPLFKRNILFVLLATQFFLTISTFFIYYTGSAFFFGDYIDLNLSGLFTRQPYIEKIAPWLTGSYLFVVVFKIMQFIFSWQQFKISGKAAWIKPSIDLKLFTRVKANEFGIRRKVNLWFSNTIHTPVTFGFLKPVILLPVALINNLSIAEAETLIIHELTHIKSNDYFFNWFLVVCETVFFFNPFISIITAKIKLEREKNCDAKVLQFNYPALNYAETLLKAARFKTAPVVFLLTAVFKNTQLIKRIRFFTEEKNLRFHKKNYSALAVLPLTTMFVLSIFLVNFIKHKKNRSATLPKTISIANARINENINGRFLTTILPVNKPAPPLTESNNEPSPAEKKITNGHTQMPAIISSQDQELLTDESGFENLVMPVVSLEEQDDSKEIILKEENSATGRSVTKVYKMKLKNGGWKAVLMWTISETRSASDSLPYLRDTTTQFYNQGQ